MTGQKVDRIECSEIERRFVKINTYLGTYMLQIVTLGKEKSVRSDRKAIFL